MRLRAPRLFLGRPAYRRRRLAEATRLVPVLFAVLAVIPPIWLPQYFSYARGAVWLATCWALAIAATALLHRALGHRSAEDEDDA